MTVLISKIQAISGCPPPPQQTCAPKLKPDPDWDYGCIWDNFLDAISFLENTERNIANYEQMSEILNSSIVERLDQSISHLVFIRDLIVYSDDKIPF
jgi:hypothetical protein